jgi:transposase-like protein
MQIIAKTHQGPEAYCREEAHFQMRPPDYCPHCDQPNSFNALGYYSRYLAGKGANFLHLRIRRFRCRRCRRTISLLPHFAQPYRLIRNRMITLFVAGTHSKQTVRWEGILKRYWRRFCRWSVKLRGILIANWGRSPPVDPEGLWDWLEHFFGGLEKASDRLIGDLQITFFGRYRCHQPNRAQEPPR